MVGRVERRNISSGMRAEGFQGVLYMLTIWKGLSRMKIVIERVFGEREGLVMYDVNLRVLLFMYVATFGQLDE
jgi:hypothetical protein